MHYTHSLYILYWYLCIYLCGEKEAEWKIEENKQVKNIALEKEDDEKKKKKTRKRKGKKIK